MTDQLPEGVGEAKVGSGGSGKINFWRLKEGSVNYRIVPPLHSLARNGTWYTWYRTHYGYKVADSKDPTVLRTRTFLCVERKDRNRNIVETCPECEEIKSRKEGLEVTRVRLSAANTPPDAQKLQLAPLEGWLMAHNGDGKYFINVMSETGEFGVLQLGSKAFRALQAELEDLRSKGEEPLSIKRGAWFRFTRVQASKRKTDVEDSVKVVTLTEKVRLLDGTEMSVPKIKTSEFTVAQLQDALECCPDLAKLGTRLTREQVELLTRSGEDPAQVAAIFAMAQPRERSASKPLPAAPKPTAAPPRAPEQTDDPDIDAIFA